MTDNENTTPKSARGAAVIAVMLLTALFAPSVQESGELGISIFSLALSGAGAAWLFYRSGYFAGVLSVALAYAINFFMSGSSVTALSVLMLLPLGICLSLASKKKIKYFYAIIISSVLVFLVTLLLLIYPVVVKTGALTFESVKVTYSDFFDAMRTVLSDSFKTVIAGKEVTIITDSNKETYVNLIISIFPGALSALVTAVCFAAGVIYRFLLGSFNETLKRPSDRKHIMSFISTALFVASLILITYGGVSGIPGIIATNVFMILLPMFFFTGIATVKEPKVVGGIIKPRLTRMILLFISLINGFIAILLVPSLFAVYDSIRACIARIVGKD